MSTIVSTFGSSDANAYCSLTEAHSIVASEALDFSSWTDASTATREAVLLRAAGEIDAIPWLGERRRRIDASQALAFPRTSLGRPGRINVLDEDESLEAERKSLSRASALHALFLLSNNDAESHDRMAAAGVKGYSYRLGELSEAFTYRAASGNVGSFARLAPGSQSAVADFPRARRLSRA